MYEIEVIEIWLDEIPEDYFNHETLLIKEVFYMIFEEYMTPQEAFKDLKLFYNISIQNFKNRLLNEGYIEENLNLDAVDEILDSYNAKKLKKILKSNDLKVPKNIEDQKALIKSEIPEKIAPKELTVTEKAEKYWNDNKDKADLFTDCCEGNFYYQEYFEVCLDNPEKNDGENLVDFIDMNYDMAFKRADHQGMIDCLDSKAYYYNVHINEFKKGCDELLKQYILRVNPVCLSERYFKEYAPVGDSLNRNIVAIVDKLSKSHVLKRFNELWDEFDFNQQFVSYDCALDYLNQMIEDGNAYKKVNKLFGKLI